MKRKLISVLLALTLAALPACGKTDADGTAAPATGTPAESVTETETREITETEEKPMEPVRTFCNPISDISAPDPYITYHDGYYYGLATLVPFVRLYRNKTVEDLFTKGEYKDIFQTGNDIGGGKTLGWNVWAPEIHYIPTTGKWCVYSCACTDGFDFGSMRMFCLESETDDPFSDYTFKGLTISNRIGIDQTVFYDEASGELYTAFCDFNERGQCIMLSYMTSPYKVGSKRVIITAPEYKWEKRGTDANNDGRVNEGPIFLKRDGRIFLLYSASGCWSQWYCLGMLEYKGKDTSRKNFLDPDNWVKSKEPVFESANEVYGVGHCSFFQSPDGTETWIAYHGMATPDAGVEGRYAYIQRIDFDEDGTPLLGEPLPRSEKIAVPSGE